MKLNNNQIFEYANKLSVFKDFNAKMPVRINFYLQKNIQLIMQATEEIEKARINIAMQFGTPNEEGNGYSIPPEKIAEVNRELNDLFNLEQDINLHLFKLDEFDNI